MTGYASGSVQANSVLLDFEIKSVNSKNLDLKIFLPEYLSVFENELRQIVLKKISRGSVFLKIKLNQQTEYQNNYVLNDKVLQNVFEKIENIERICDEKNIPLEPLKALDFLAVKGVWEENKNSSTNIDDIKKIVLDKIEELVVSLLQTRKKEGQGLHSILSEKLSSLIELRKAAEKTLPARSNHLKKNFKSTIDGIISETSKIDENKVEQEIAIIAIKLDITEELDRLKVHIESMQDLLSSSGVVGKKLDFLSQELNREVNTICSKSQYSDLTKLGIEMKTVVDQFREQIQNVE
ncbi:MAG: YicC family protein [Paracoccaceae bacterium]|nr:YicC family protein [Paracoccaceae bacterium]